MKISIRRGVFETNSSSTHSLTICTDDEFKKWQNNEMLFDTCKKKLVTIEEAFEDWRKDKIKYHYDEIKDLSEEKLFENFQKEVGLFDYSNSDGEEDDDDYDGWSDYQTYDKWCEEEYLELYEVSHTTKSGDNIVIFGKYGHD